MKYTIYLDAEGRLTLGEKFGVNPSQVSKALRFLQMNRKASEMRSYAVNHLNGMLLEV
jgi:hypothetical protein